MFLNSDIFQFETLSEAILKGLFRHLYIGNFHINCFFSFYGGCLRVIKLLGGSSGAARVGAVNQSESCSFWFNFNVEGGRILVSRRVPKKTIL